MKHLKMLLIMAALVLISASLFASDEAWVMRYPDIHMDKVTFSYAGDIWVASSNGGYARRLTTAEGVEYFPKFSPDGKMIAFTGQYDGYFQVYVIPAEGGEAKQLTYYPTGPMSDRSGFNNQVMDWTPDGKHIVFRSIKDHWHPYVGRYYKISPDGGWAEPYPFMEGSTMSFSPDGTKIAFNRTFRDFRTWKRYKGGREQDILMFDLKKKKTTTLVDWPATEKHPMWHGDKIYFTADKTGTLNIYTYDTKTAKVIPVTEYTDWDVNWPGFGPDAIVYELGGKLFRMAFEDHKIRPIKVNIAYDATKMKPKYKNVSKSITEFDISPGGKRASFIARGEIFTVPAKKGDIRDISNTPGARESAIAWSPDGKWIAFISDRNGQEELYITCPLGKKTIQLTKNSSSIVRSPVWSPDSKKIAFVDQAHGLYYVDLKTKKITKMDSAKIWVVLALNWAPDSKWITYTKLSENRYASIYIYNLKSKKVHSVTDNMTNDFGSSFSPDGKYLYFNSSRTLNPDIGNFELNHTYNGSSRLYVLTLKKDTPSPFEPESDEAEPVKKEEKENKDKKDKDKKKKKVKVDIDFDGLSGRISEIPTGNKPVFNFSPIEDGILYVRSVGDRAPGSPPSTVLFGYDLKEKKETEMLKGARNFLLSADKKKLIYSMRGKYGIADSKIEKIDTSKGMLNTSGMEARIDYREEWMQMFLEAWRLEKHFFYVENMHGVDWDRMLKKYMPLVKHITHRRDLTYVIGEMIGELSIGHTYTGGGDMPKLSNSGISLLGCTFEMDKEAGLFKIGKIYAGENWHKNSRSPLTEPGIKAAEGNYILAINGKELKAPMNPYSLLVKTMGKIVTLKLNSKPEDEGSWEIKIKPVATEAKLKYLDWVETNRRIVDKATNGKVGYLHMSNMSFEGLTGFVKDWYHQLNKDGIIIDVRYNGGGFLSQTIFERLRRFVKGIRYSRWFGTGTIPTAAYSGHLVLLMNRMSASDGDIFPYFFREYGLGKIIGMRTWGGVVGIYGMTPLMDGGYVSIPTVGLYSREGEWIIEGIGVTPDIEIDRSPEEMVTDVDSQMKKAIDVILKQIDEKPIKYPSKPADPVKN